MIRATWGARRRALGVPLRLGRASAPRERSLSAANCLRYFAAFNLDAPAA